MNGFLETKYSFHSKTWAGRPPKLAGILYVKIRAVIKETEFSTAGMVWGPRTPV